MKEIGLGENLKMAGIFNFNADAENILNHQLLAQMLWYLLEGIDIQKRIRKNVITILLGVDR